jgi:hypothetical protein
MNKNQDHFVWQFRNPWNPERGRNPTIVLNDARRCVSFLFPAGFPDTSKHAGRLSGLTCQALRGPAVVFAVELDAKKPTPSEFGGKES